MLRFISLTALCAVTASFAYAGGWETGKLDTSFLYESGNYAEFSYGNLDYSIEGTTQAGVTHKMAKDQTRVSVSGKFNLGRLEIGISSFDSGAIQMDGQSAATSRAACATAASTSNATAMGQNCSIVASADANLDTQAIITKYKLNDNFSLIGGLRRVKLADSTVGTLRTDYSINSNSETGAIYGVAYSRPDIALRLELIHSEAKKMKLSGTANGLMAASFGNNVPFADNSELNVPKAMTLKFQTGIAKDTLLMASVHRVDWKVAQIDLNFNGAAAAATLDIASDFSDTTAYSIGLGRKFTDNTSGSISYSWEDGAGATSTSGFTMSNGSKTISLGLKHKLDNVTISGGVSYTEVGDVDVAKSGLTSAYSNNSVTALGFKIGYNF